MPIVKSPALLMETYNAVKQNISKIPSEPLRPADMTVYRSVPLFRLQKPADGQPVSASALVKSLTPFDGSTERNNRYSGPADPARSIPGSGHVICCGGLYCALQQQALVNEMAHYGHRPGDLAVNDKAILKIRVRSTLMAAVLSPHNSGTVPFLQSIRKTLKDILDPFDCSVPRGIGLAIAHSGIYSGLIFETARNSDRSDEERGDNIVFFGSTRHAIPSLYVETVTFFNPYDKTSSVHPVSF